ncbi:NINE protein [Brachybacterium vulturis]|uniref:NINE protein n=1 Tax=Brachybacterium vulturis TaxID=2017484 RepID=UPI0037352BB8
MSNPGDHGSWNPQGHDDGAPPGARNDAGQPPRDPWAQPPASDPYGQQPFAGQDPFGQGQQGWSPPPGSGPSASDPYEQPGAAGPVPPGQPQSRLVVGLLGIFLGGLGVHRFLMGYTTIGIIQILVTVFTCGLGAWWGVIEGIMVLARSPAFERDAYGRPLTD